MKKTLYIALLFLNTHSMNANNELTHPDAIELSSQLEIYIQTTIDKITKLEQLNGNNDFALSLSPSNSQTRQFGLIINPKNNLVLAKTPNSIADQMGIKINDQIKSLMINRKEIEINSIYQGIKLKANDLIKLSLLRNSKPIDISFTVPDNSKINWLLTSKVSNSKDTIKGCGRIDQTVIPSSTKFEHPVKIIKIDGKSVVPKNVYRLSTGRHVITLHEQINDEAYFRFIPKRVKRKAVDFEIEIEANQSYEIVAKYISSRDRDNPKEYWKPIIKSTKEIDCSGYLTN